MRRLKHKHTRRAVQFYEINYGFRKPFKVEAMRLCSCAPTHSRTASSSRGTSNLFL